MVVFDTIEKNARTCLLVSWKSRFSFTSFYLKQKEKEKKQNRLNNRRTGNKKYKDFERYSTLLNERGSLISFRLFNFTD